MADTTTKILQILLQMNGAESVKTESVKAQNAIKSLGNEIGSNLKTAVLGLAGTYLGSQGLRAAWDWTVGAAAEEEAAMRRVQTSVELAGYEYKKAKPLIDAFTSSITELTEFSDDEAASAFGQVLNLTQDINKAFRGAEIALNMTSQGFGNLEGNTIIATRALMDGHAMIGRMVMSLDDIEKKFGGAAQENVKKFAGVIRQAKNEFSDLGESIGNLVLPVLTEFIQKAKEGGQVRTLSGVIGDIATYVNSLDVGPWEKLALLLSLQYPGAFQKAAEAAEAFRKEQVKIAENAAKLDFGTITVTAEDLTRKYLDEAGVLYSLGQRTTAQMITLYEEAVRAYEKNTEKKEAAEKKLHEFKLRLFEEEEQAKIESMRRVEALNMKFWLELKKRIREIVSTTPSLGGGGEGINGVGAGSNTGIGAGGLKMDFGTFASEINALSTEAISKIKSIGYVFLDVVNGILDGLRSAGVEIADWVSNVMDGINAAASGDIRGVVASVVHAITSPFTEARDRERQRAEDQRRSIEALTREIDANIASIDQMTEAEKRRRKEALEAEIQRLRLEMETRGFTGREREGALSNIANYQRELNALMGEFADDTALRGLKSLKDVIGYITGQGTDLTYNAASGIAGHFSQMFNLSLEEQMALWGTIRDTLIANGNYTIDQLWQIDETLKGLKDQIAEEKKRARESGVQSQIYRSVTTITERQANLMVDILNAISLHVRQILETLRESLNQLPRPAALTGGAGNINIYGPITVKANDPKAFVDAFVAEARGRGFKAA